MRKKWFRNAIVSPIAAAIAVVVFLGSAPAFSTPMTKDTIEQYFTSLKTKFDRLAENPLLKKPQVKPVNNLFMATMKKSQPVYSYVRINAKGVVINEIVRSQMPEKVKKKVSDQKWFKHISKTATEYYGFTYTEENGRYYLFWVNPILDSKKHFLGAVVAKIDLWDCFREMSQETNEPFLIRLEGKSLFEDKWKNPTSTVSIALTIPGISKIVLVNQKPVADTLASVRKDTAVVAAVSPVVSGTELPKKQPAFFEKNKVLLIAVGILLLGVIIFLLIKMYSWLSNEFTMNKINKPDDNPYGRR